MVAINNLY